MALRDDWKETGKSLGNAFASLGKTIVKSATEGAKKVNEWTESGSNTENAANGETIETTATDKEESKEESKN